MSKRPFRVNFENMSNMTTEDLLESEVLLKVIKIEVPKAIAKAKKENKTYATIFEINSLSVFVEIHKKDWINALNSCLAICAKDEEYEACVDINKTLQLLSKTTKVKP